MRDVLALGETLAAMVAASALGSACSSEPPPMQSRQEPGSGAPLAPATLGAPAPVPPSAGTRAPAAPDRFAERPGDPPFVDGYDPEEAPCPSGNWCASPAIVAPFAIATAAPIDGCPARIAGTGGADMVWTPAHEGLSRSPAMLGSYNTGRTERRRRAGADGICCYHWFEYCSGRPLRNGSESVRAQARPGAGWNDAVVPMIEHPRHPAAREHLARAWLRDALAEHASVASFARAVLELMAVGAPAELIGAHVQAAADEIRHARACLGLHAAYDGRSREPGPLAPAAARSLDLEQLALATLAEGAVGETVATLAALRARERCEIPAVREVLTMIAEDELRHAALAWSTLRWLSRSGGPAVAAAARGWTDRAPRAAIDEPAPPPGLDLARHGRMSAADQARCLEDVWRDVVPMMLATGLAA